MGYGLDGYDVYRDVGIPPEQIAAQHEANEHAQLRRATLCLAAAVGTLGSAVIVSEHVPDGSLKLAACVAGPAQNCGESQAVVITLGTTPQESTIQVTVPSTTIPETSTSETTTSLEPETTEPPTTLPAPTPEPAQNPSPTKPLDILAAGAQGLDRNWPQCQEGNLSKSARDVEAGTSFSIFGLDDGTANLGYKDGANTINDEGIDGNPCLADQVAQARTVLDDDHIFYYVNDTNREEYLPDFRHADPKKHIPKDCADEDTLCESGNAGYASGVNSYEYALAQDKTIVPKLVAVDVEWGKDGSWLGDPSNEDPGSQQDNAEHIKQKIAGMIDAAKAHGNPAPQFILYSFQRAWDQIVGDAWQAPYGAWFAGGKGSYDELPDVCQRPSFTAGKVVMAQGVDRSIDTDIDLKCHDS